MTWRAAVLGLFLAATLTAQPVPLIFDTDMGNDIDDALALGMIHALQSKGECRLLAVTVTKDHAKAAEFVSAINEFYGRGDIPIGVVRDGVTPEEGDYLASVADHPELYPRQLAPGESRQEAVSLLRQTLASQPDGSVVIVQVGFSTNLARLVENRGSREIVRRKVKLLSLMGGAFPPANPEYNIKTDLGAANALFANWPTDIVVSGFEIGKSILYPATSIETDFAYIDHHPLVDAYRAYMDMPYDRPTWDLTSVLYAVRPDGDYFGISPPGKIRVDPQGHTLFTATPDGPHRYLTVNEAQRAQILETLIELVTRAPDVDPRDRPQ